MRITLICCLLLLTFTFTHAQESTPEPADGWTIEQRCVAEPTTPPDDWSFDGTILTLDDIGVHGVRSDWETPHVLAYTNMINPNKVLVGGSLSPDMEWYAAAEANLNPDLPIVIDKLRSFHINEENPHNDLSIDWFYSYADDANLSNIPHIAWLDNERFVYTRTIYDEYPGLFGYRELRLVSPFANLNEAWTNPYNPMSNNSVSPDMSRYFEYEITGETWHRYLVDAALGEHILEFHSGSSLLETNIWSPNSAYFLHVNHSDEAQVELALYDRDGSQITSLLTMMRASVYNSFGFKVAWSPNSRYFIFNIGRELTVSQRIANFTVYVVDLQQQTIIDLCLNIIDYPMWSPNNDAVAFYVNNEIQVINLTTSAYYTVAYDTGIPIGWRADN